MSDTPRVPSSGNVVPPAVAPSDFKVYKAPASSSGSPRAFMGPGSRISGTHFGGLKWENCQSRISLRLRPISKPRKLP